MKDIGASEMQKNTVNCGKYELLAGFLSSTGRIDFHGEADSASKNPQPPGETCIKLLEFPSTKVMSTSATPRDIFPLMLSHHHPVLLPIFHPPNASNCLRRSKTREKTYKSTFLMMIQLTFESHYKRRLFDVFLGASVVNFSPPREQTNPPCENHLQICLRRFLACSLKEQPRMRLRCFAMKAAPEIGGFEFEPVGSPLKWGPLWKKWWQTYWEVCLKRGHFGWHPETFSIS